MGCGASQPQLEPQVFADAPALRPSKRLYKIVCIGVSGVGKTSLMHRWVRGSAYTGEYKTTIGADFMAKTIDLPDGSKAMLQVWDTAGQEKFASLGRAFFRGSDLCVLVCALNDPRSLAQLVVWKKDFLDQAEPEDVLGFPFILIANKADLERNITKEQVEQWARVNQVAAAFECSAQSGAHVDEAFEYAAKLCAKLEDDKNRGARRLRCVLWDVDNTLYPRSCGLGKAMGDRIVAYIRSRIDPAQLHPPPPTPAADVEVNVSYNHPSSITPSDDAIERVCVEYYVRYGLSLTGFLKHYGALVSEADYLQRVHEPSERMSEWLPDPHVHHAATTNLVRTLHARGVHQFVFSNAPRAHVDRVLAHLGIDDPALWAGSMHYDLMREHSKPNPGGYVMAMAMVRAVVPDILPDEILFLDDARVNLEAGKRLGWRTCHIVGGLPVPDDAPYVDHSVDDVRDTTLLNLLTRSL